MENGSQAGREIAWGSDFARDRLRALLRVTGLLLFVEFGFFGGVGGAFEVEAVTVGVGQRGDPHGVADERAFRLDSTRFDLAINLEGVDALEADGYANAGFIG